MKISGNAVVITGGASGIGFALAGAFLKQGNQVIICGRQQDKLDEASRSLPGVKTIQADITTSQGRSALINQSLSLLPNLNIVVNNAGIMQPIQINDVSGDLEELLRQEVEVDCIAPILLSTQFLPHLKKQPAAAIINVTTGLVFAPSAAYPFYAVAKTGLRAFTQSLRFQLRNSNIKVFEVLPPAVDTELNKSSDKKISPQQVASETIKGLENSVLEIKIGQSKILAVLARISPSFAYSMINR